MNKKLRLASLAIVILLPSLTLFKPQVNVASLPAFETRCGWFSNPTPANASLFDRDAEWIIGVQGGHQADGDWPAFGDNQWVETNGHYGYGCACMSVTVNQKSHEVIRINSAKARPLSACRSDRALKRWGFK